MAFPTTPVLDTFDRANGAIGSNFTINEGGFNVTTNKITGTGADNGAWWNVNQFEKDQEIYMDIDTLPGSGAVFIMFLRWNWVTDTGYYAIFTDGGAGTDSQQIFRRDAGVDTQLGATNSLNFTAGDVFGASAIGTSIACYRNTTTLFTRTDATYNVASFIGFYTDSTAVRLDNFGGGTTRLKSLPIFKRKQQVWPRRF